MRSRFSARCRSATDSIEQPVELDEHVALDAARRARRGCSGSTPRTATPRWAAQAGGRARRRAGSRISSAPTPGTRGARGRGAGSRESTNAAVLDGTAKHSPWPAEHDRGVDADHAAVGVEQRAAGVARVERRVGLDHALDRAARAWLAQRAAERADDAERHGARQAEGRADGDRRTSPTRSAFESPSCGVGQGRGGRRRRAAAARSVAGSSPDDVGEQRAAVGELDLDAGRAVHDVAVGQRVAVGRRRARPSRWPGWAAPGRPQGAHVQDRRADALDDPFDLVRQRAQDPHGQSFGPACGAIQPAVRARRGVPGLAARTRPARGRLVSG